LPLLFSTAMPMISPLELMEHAVIGSVATLVYPMLVGW
jgi:hypothetical protein